MKRKSALVFLLLFGLLPGAAWTAGEGNGKAAAVARPRVEIEKSVVAVVKLQQQTGRRRRAWLEERARLTEETHNLELEARLLRSRLKRLRAYRRQRRGEIERLQAGLAKLERISLELDPALDELAARLDAFVAGDLPFAVAERRQRLARLHRELERYDSRPAERLRRLFETLKIEVGYGRGFEVGEEKLKLDGVETTVQVLRLGRIGLYYLTLDGRRAGWYDPRRKVWEPLPAAFQGAVREALRMALKQRAFDLVRLPVVSREGGGDE